MLVFPLYFIIQLGKYFIIQLCKYYFILLYLQFIFYFNSDWWPYGGRGRLLQDPHQDQILLDGISLWGWVGEGGGKYYYTLDIHQNIAILYFLYASTHLLFSYYITVSYHLYLNKTDIFFLVSLLGYVCIEKEDFTCFLFVHSIQCLYLCHIVACLLIYIFYLVQLLLFVRLCALYRIYVATQTLNSDCRLNLKIHKNITWKCPCKNLLPPLHLLE